MSKITNFRDKAFLRCQTLVYLVTHYANLRIKKIMKGRTTAMKGNRISLFAGFINFFSYFFLVPFSVKWDGNNYIVKSSKFGKVQYKLIMQS